MQVNPIKLLAFITENIDQTDEGIKKLTRIYREFGLEWNSLEGGDNINSKGRSIIMHARRMARLHKLIEAIEKVTEKSFEDKPEVETKDDVQNKVTVINVTVYRK